MHKPPTSINNVSCCIWFVDKMAFKHEIIIYIVVQEEMYIVVTCQQIVRGH